MVRSSGLHAAALACQVVAKGTGCLHLPRLVSMSRIVSFQGSLAAWLARIEAQVAGGFRHAIKLGGPSFQARPHRCGTMLDRLARWSIMPYGLRTQDGDLRCCLAA